MSVRLVILGLLGERPLYGYEIKQIIEQYMGDWTSIAFGSIYFALDKLSEEGFVEKVAVEQAGHRPSRSVYKITGAGRSEFMRLLRATWVDVERAYFSLDICLFFFRALPLEDVKGYLQGRVAAMHATLEYLHQHRTEQLAKADIPRLAEGIFDHTVFHVQAELSWLENLLQKIEVGEYP